MPKIPPLSLLFKIAGFLALSYILVHVFAFLGFFCAVAYPLLWLFAPQYTPCLLCRFTREGERCRFCGQIVHRGQFNSTRSFFPAILNGVLILIISIVCLLLVLGEQNILLRFGFSLVPRTASFNLPSQGNYRLGEIFPMKIEITGFKVPINAIQADIGFDAQRLEVVDISTKDSFAKIFLHKEINNELGYARLTGGLPNPGFSDKSGVFGTVFFRGKSPGLAKVEFLPTSLVLANNGQGSNLLKGLGAVSYLILPESISEKEREQQQEMLNDKVLGMESEEEGQLVFYSDVAVLGRSTSTSREIPPQKSFGQLLVFWLGKVDDFILSFWKNLFSFLPK